jgi:hypothetical protein
MITEGVVAFSNLTETEQFNGKDTGKFSIVLTLDESEAAKLSEAGVKVKEYQNTPQRKFVTKFPDFPVLDIDGDVHSKHIRYGSKVKVLWDPGQPHPEHGVCPYFKKIKVLEDAEGGEGSEGDEEF